MVTCPYCTQPALLVGGKEIYPHRPDLFSKHFWQCKPCDAYVGCHDAGVSQGDGTSPNWNPLTDDGDALRLAVKLNIDLMNATGSEDGGEGQSVTFPIRGDYDAMTEWHDATSEKQAATRRAIVRAAAEIGKALTATPTAPATPKGGAA